MENFWKKNQKNPGNLLWLLPLANSGTHVRIYVDQSCSCVSYQIICSSCCLSAAYFQYSFPSFVSCSWNDKQMFFVSCYLISYIICSSCCLSVAHSQHLFVQVLWLLSHAAEMISRWYYLSSYELNFDEMFSDQHPVLYHSFLQWLIAFHVLLKWTFVVLSIIRSYYWILVC